MSQAGGMPSTGYFLGWLVSKVSTWGQAFGGCWRYRGEQDRASVLEDLRERGVSEPAFWYFMNFSKTETGGGRHTPQHDHLLFLARVKASNQDLISLMRVGIWSLEPTCLLVLTTTSFQPSACLPVFIPLSSGSSPDLPRPQHGPKAQPVPVCLGLSQF